MFPYVGEEHSFVAQLVVVNIHVKSACVISEHPLVHPNINERCAVGCYTVPNVSLISCWNVDMFKIRHFIVKSPFIIKYLN